MRNGVNATTIFKLDNYFLMTSMNMTIVIFNSIETIGGLFSLVDTYI